MLTFLCYWYFLILWPYVDNFRDVASCKYKKNNHIQKNRNTKDFNITIE